MISISAWLHSVGHYRLVAHFQLSYKSHSFKPCLHCIWVSFIDILVTLNFVDQGVKPKNAKQRYMLHSQITYILNKVSTKHFANTNKYI